MWLQHLWLLGGRKQPGTYMPSSWVEWWRGVVQHRTNHLKCSRRCKVLFSRSGWGRCWEVHRCTWGDPATKSSGHTSSWALSFSVYDMASLVGWQVQNLNKFILQKSELTTLEVFVNLGLSIDHLQGLWLSLSPVLWGSLWSFLGLESLSTFFCLLWAWCHRSSFCYMENMRVTGPLTNR